MVNLHFKIYFYLKKIVIYIFVIIYTYEREREGESELHIVAGVVKMH